MKYISKKVIFVTLLFIVLSESINAQSKTFYVAPNGSNSNSGLTIDKPFGSINSAIEKVSAGDTIYIISGTYKELILLENKNGVPEKPIYILGYSKKVDDYPVIDGGLIKPSSDAENDWIHIKNSEWIEISRLKFKNGWTLPIRVDNSSYLTFNSCYFYGGKRVINAGGLSTHHILVENCYWDQGGKFLWKVEKDTAGVEAWLSMHHVNMAYYNGSLIDFSGTGGSMVIRKNTIINAFNGVRFRGQKGCDSNIEIYDNNVSFVRDNDFEPEYYTYNLHIYHNVSHNIHKTVSVDNVEGGQIYYYGNIVTSDSDPWTRRICTGIWKLYGVARKLSYPMYAFNNSFFTYGTAFLTMKGPVMYFRHFNNAYFFETAKPWDLNAWDPSYQFDYDVSNKPWAENIIKNKQEAHGKIFDIKFIDPSKRNLMLQPDSKGIDAGKIISIKEMGWTQSYSGKAPDVGAYENGKFVEGPPFRFMKEAESKIEYKEKPRIVRDKVEGNKLIIYFSAPVNPSSVRKELVELFSGEKKVDVKSVSVSAEKYSVTIKSNSELSTSDLSLVFKQMPKGMNGEQVTYWASTIKIHKK